MEFDKIILKPKNFISYSAECESLIYDNSRKTVGKIKAYIPNCYMSKHMLVATSNQNFKCRNQKFNFSKF